MSGSTWAPGSNPVSNVSGTLVPQSFTAAAGQNTFNIGNFTYTPNTSSLWVFVNGVFQTSGTDFTEAANNQFVFTSNLQGGEIVTCIGMPTVIGATGIGAAASFNSLLVNKNATAAPAAISAASIVQIVGADGSGPIEQLDGFANPSGFALRRANGTNAIKSALAINDTIGQFNVYGYGATGYSATNRGQFLFSAAENWTDVAQGTTAKILATPIGSIIPQVVATFATAGSSLASNLSVTGSISITSTNTPISFYDGIANRRAVLYTAAGTQYQFGDLDLQGYSTRIIAGVGGSIYQRINATDITTVSSTGLVVTDGTTFTAQITTGGVATLNMGSTAGTTLTNLRNNGATVIAMSTTGAAITGTLAVTGQFAANGAVLAAPPAGYGTPTGSVRLINFPGATATLAQTSAQLAQLIIDLKGTGLIAA